MSTTHLSRSFIGMLGLSDGASWIGHTAGNLDQSIIAASGFKVSTDVDTILQAASADAFLTAAGFTAFTLTLRDDASASAALTTLGLTEHADSIWETGTNTTPTIVAPDAIAAAVTAQVPVATDAEIRSATGTRKFIDADALESAAAAVTLTDAATVAFDWDSGLYFNLTITDNRTIGNPTNGQPGTTRTIYVVGNDATNRSLAWSANFKGSVPSYNDHTSTKGYLYTVFCVTSSHFVVTGVQAL